MKDLWTSEIPLRALSASTPSSSDVFNQERIILEQLEVQNSPRRDACGSLVGDLTNCRPRVTARLHRSLLSRRTRNRHLGGIIVNSRFLIK